ncbi:AAA family ATPase [bacterium]|nr:MAG: AAA family ATPase [bacterium]
MMFLLQSLVVVLLIQIFGPMPAQHLYAAAQAGAKPAAVPAPSELRAAEEMVRQLREHINEAHGIANAAVNGANQALALAYTADTVSINLSRGLEPQFLRIQELVLTSRKLDQDIASAQQAVHDVQKRIGDFKVVVEKESQEIYEQVRQEAAKKNQETLEDRIRVAQEKINEKQRRGIFEQGEKIRAQATVDAEEVKWQRIKEILEDPYLIAKFIGGLTGFALGFYLIKYGVPLVIDYFSKPRVISETSYDRWFWQDDVVPETELKDLFFTPNVQEQLFDLVLRIDSAQSFNENLPNVLLYGPPGTGKTAFVKALAHESNCDYALTSGSEFAKITDLNALNDELRKLIEWANEYADDSKGLIVFIDEAESLFANRKLTTTSIFTQNLINTFLALVQDGGQKNIMFIFATNHPFKLDDAFLDRLGVSIEIELPGVQERALILAAYLEKFANNNKSSVVPIVPDVMKNLLSYAHAMEGFSPRTIKCIAEEMIVVARRQKKTHLTHAIVDDIIKKTQTSQQKMQLWEKEREQWVNAYVSGLSA